MSRYFLLLLLLFATPFVSHAASLALSPPAGTFTVGSTVDISIFIDSAGASINAVSANLQFPPAKLQLVSPSVGKSVIGVWVTAPQFNNQTGTINLEGVIPGGLKTSQGLLTTLTFRVKSVGPAVVKFLSQSKVLLNDGVGTDALDKIQNGIYQLILPPPAGPLVVSETHPDQTKWYANTNAVLSWASDESEVQGYSYILNDEPVDIPDDISEGVRTGVSYRALGEGRHYFHIKVLRANTWGETTHFAVLVDATPPAAFPVTILPEARTSSHQPIIQFSTTDNSSGLDHYELKLVPLQPDATKPTKDQPFFVESTSPYVSPGLNLGNYDVIVRAYDQAGNYREVVKRLAIVTPLFRFISDQGLLIQEKTLITWPWLVGILLLVILILIYLARHLRFIHFHLHRASQHGQLPDHVQNNLSELEKYRARYGKALMVILILASSLTMARAETINPPIITTISRHLSNQEIFYLGGKSANPNSEVVIYLQNPASGEVTSFKTATDDHGDWFYRHDTFLPAGDYLLWTQERVDNQLSPPSAQQDLTVASQAMQLGASRLSYAAIYLVIIFILLISLIILITDLVIHARRIKHKRAHLHQEISEAEESVRRGFALLKRDLEEELSVIKKAKLYRALATAERETERQLRDDLAAVEKYISKELWDVQRVGYNK